MTDIEKQIVDEVANDNNTQKSVFKRCSLAFLVAFLIIAAVSNTKIILIDKTSLEEFSLISHVCLTAFFAILLYSAYIFIYSQRKNTELSVKAVAAITTIIIFTYLVSLFSSLIGLFVMPLYLAAVLLATLIDSRIAFVANSCVNLLVFMSLSVSGTYDIYALITLLMIGALGSALIVNRITMSTRRINYMLTLLLAGVLTFIPMLVGHYLSLGGLNELKEDAVYLVIGLMAQILLSIILQPILESLFNLVTNQRLTELTDYRRPLLKRLQTEAPGTFNHSLQVANLAETCATAIGENPYMARAAAFYHDVGKLKNCSFFTENQASDYNPHDDLMPEVSRDIIIGHTTGGYQLCREYGLPKEICDITIEHHGTLPIALFYNKARQMTDAEVDIDDYQYHGATPSTKIAALIMICDSCEAAVRSMNKPTFDRVDNLVKMLINYRLTSGQFDNCNITMRDLHTIRKTIVEAFGGLYHNRISYDNKDKK